MLPIIIIIMEKQRLICKILVYPLPATTEVKMVLLLLLLLPDRWTDYYSQNIFHGMINNNNHHHHGASGMDGDGAGRGSSSSSSIKHL